MLGFNFHYFSSSSKMCLQRVCVLRQDAWTLTLVWAERPLGAPLTLSYHLHLWWGVASCLTSSLRWKQAQLLPILSGSETSFKKASLQGNNVEDFLVLQVGRRLKTGRTGTCQKGWSRPQEMAKHLGSHMMGGTVWTDLATRQVVI